MEVHHHPHAVKKKFKEYFLEFLMIFLAVTLGFFAESYREHRNDRAKEKEYMMSLTRDLQNNIRAMDSVFNDRIYRNNLADSVILSFRKGDYKNNTGNLYYFGRLIGFRYYFRPDDGTIQQLNNAGGLRLIQKENVLDSLQHYINLTKTLVQMQTLEESELYDFRGSINHVFDALLVDEMYNNKRALTISKLPGNPPLFSYNKKDLNEFIMQVVIIKANRLAQMEEINALKSSASSLIQLVKKEYYLKNE
jgi:hypothetical protein